MLQNSAFYGGVAASKCVQKMPKMRKNIKNTKKPCQTPKKNLYLYKMAHQPKNMAKIPRTVGLQGNYYAAAMSFIYPPPHPEVLDTFSAQHKALGLPHINYYFYCYYSHHHHHFRHCLIILK
jgi:hypothetical protein